jgi:hypothetical protein
MSHASYYKCAAEGCGERWATEEKPPRCPACGGKKREKLPSVTYVLGSLGWKTEGLKHWAHKMGEQGVELGDALDVESTVGSLAHMGIRADILGQPFDLELLAAQWNEEQINRVRRSLRAWHEWRANSKLAMIATELPLVSRLLDYGGTLDGGVASVGGRVGIIDFKTGGIYAEAIIQVAAYGVLWTEHHPEQLIEEFHLLGLGKDTGAFHHHRIPAEEVRPAGEAFAHLLALHRLRKPLEALL